MRRGLPERALASLVTGPVGFAVAGAIDVLLGLRMVVRYVLRTRLRELSRR